MKNKILFLLFYIIVIHFIQKVVCKKKYIKIINQIKSINLKNKNRKYFFIKNDENLNKIKNAHNFLLKNGNYILKEKKPFFFFNYFKKRKNFIEKLKELNDKNSLWYFTGYAKNIFYENSLFQIIGFEKIDKIDYKKLLLNNVLNFDFEKIISNEKISNESLIIDGYKVNKFVIFYNINEKSNIENNYNKDEINIKKDIMNNNIKKKSNNFILCNYNYFMFYVLDKKNNKNYIIIHNNNYTITYDITELDNTTLYNILKSINDEMDIKNINIISLNYKSKNEINNIKKIYEKNNFFNNKFFHKHNIEKINYKDNFSNLKLKNTLIYSNTNFFLKDKNFICQLKNFFIRNDDLNLFNIIFKNNKGYKLYIQENNDKNVVYILKSTKINKKKFNKLNKLFSSNWNLEKENKNILFSLNKILFEKFKSKLKENIKNMYDMHSQTIYVNIDEKDYLIDNKFNILRKTDENILFHLVKYYLKKLIFFMNI